MARLPQGTRIGSVHLTVADLERSERFYVDALGLRRLDLSNGALSLGVDGERLLVLYEEPGARRVLRTTGLFHFALLVPQRSDLGNVIRHLVDFGWPIQGASDHGVSEALYLSDPDGNGIEVYRDRPRSEWPFEGDRLSMVTERMDVDGVLDAAQGEWMGLSAGTTMGHIHLHVADLDAAQTFYVERLGFEVTQRYGSQALFVSAGGYHHHVGLNTWAGVGAPPPPPGSVGLRYFEVIVPGGESETLADPSGNTVHVVAP